VAIRAAFGSRRSPRDCHPSSLIPIRLAQPWITLPCTHPAPRPEVALHLRVELGLSGRLNHPNKQLSEPSTAETSPYSFDSGSVRRRSLSWQGSAPGVGPAEAVRPRLSSMSPPSRWPQHVHGHANSLRMDRYRLSERTPCIVPRMDSWVLPAAGQALKHRKEIAGAWKAIRTHLQGRKARLVITGAPGVGKTVLFDYLTGAAYKRGYEPPLPSNTPEKKTLRLPNARIGLNVIPGQESQLRYETREKLFGSRPALAGVIYVVCGGFTALRNDTAENALVANNITTLSEFRAFQQAVELSDFQDTCELVRRSIRQHRRPPWMILLISKADLWWNDKLAIQSDYAFSSTSPFVQTLTALTSRVGSDNFRSEAMPVACWLDEFSYNGQQVPSTLSSLQRDHMIATFAETIERYCES